MEQTHTIKFDEILKEIDKGYVRVQKHPTAPYYIYNYTQKCQVDGAWNETTRMCRGLILDDDQNIIARPFAKFFNLSEHEGETLPGVGEVQVFEKYDGSLGIVYWEGGMPYVATRGSFTSDQAKKASRMLSKIVGDSIDAAGALVLQSRQNKTPLFEIIYPENRIVVDYGAEEKLVYLGSVNNETGADSFDDYMCNQFPSAKVYDFTDIHNLPTRENAEGYVVRWSNGFRVKLKFDEYVRLHRIVTGVTERRIWDILRNGQSTKELIENVPEEFSEWVTRCSTEIMCKYLSIEADALRFVYEQKLEKMERKQAAQLIMKEHKNICSVLFKILDYQKYDHIIWKLIKPDATQPFKKEV